MNIKFRLTLRSPIWIVMACHLSLACTKNTTGRSNTLIIGMNTRSSNALVCLAEKEHAKRGKGKKWRILLVDRTENALDDLLKNKVDIAIAAPPSFYRFALENPKSIGTFKILAGINSIQNSFAIISSIKSNIHIAKDLRYKRLGHLGDYTEFFKNYFLLTEGINETQVKQFTYAYTSALLKALEDNKLDAAIVPEEITNRIDKKKYVPFFSKVHEITAQIVIKKDTLSKDRETIQNFIETLISIEKELYLDPKQSLERLKACYPKSHEAILKGLLQQRELRVLIDESLRAQYASYKKWLLSKPRFQTQIPAIRAFDVQNHIDPTMLREIDFRRVLIR